MALTLARAVDLLGGCGLLREVIAGGTWTLDADDVDGDRDPIGAVTYDTRRVGPRSMLFIKGRFEPRYLDGVDDRGLAAYVAETSYADHTRAPGIIVNDVRRAMSLLAAEFYGRPQEDLTLIGITGTKGKTTTAYFTQAILNAHSHGRAALLSSVDNCLDGRTYRESELTTPESLDLFRMMRDAADNGMRYLIMEVSSQAYKVERVYGLTFDVGAFLNISPDHISPIEHPTFEDYLYCKRRITANSRALVLGADCQHADLIAQDARAARIPTTTFALHDNHHHTPATITARELDITHNSCTIRTRNGSDATFSLSIDGAFNYANAAAAVCIVHELGVDAEDPQSLHAMEKVRIAGRMEEFSDAQSPTLVIVDYAHNYSSVTALLDFVQERFGSDDPRITMVTGAAGNKAYGRREEIVRACEDRIARFVFTSEDTDTEPFEDICRTMLSHVRNPDVQSEIILDRTAAVEDAIRNARTHADRRNVVLVIGKGDERWIKDRNRHVPYEGDDAIARRLCTV
ncbi:MAG: UDP-N-acetylmuramoyl-L-alanyl-D-glutamate--2,6-diaminopimelate ligase [Bifidobacterium sp.]|jgi:UDP-N-acetylmuramoyl-L-alanyl-D-glutamate--2,6-diaminopimelate ligase|nr:UDP-N-acetylmuramoyl-L-alanyl-D-glutamate--2,6-diaminopimelate ligase [Bifidobacterium sp.]